jgi:hypothetical protein
MGQAKSKKRSKESNAFCIRTKPAGLTFPLPIGRLLFALAFQPLTAARSLHSLTPCVTNEHVTRLCAPLRKVQPFSCWPASVAQGGRTSGAVTGGLRFSLAGRSTEECGFESKHLKEVVPISRTGVLPTSGQSEHEEIRADSPRALGCPQPNRTTSSFLTAEVSLLLPPVELLTSNSIRTAITATAYLGFCMRILAHCGHFHFRCLW